MLRQRLTLTILWWSWGLALFLLLAALSYQPAIFGEDSSAAWEWFLPNITPTMMLVGAVAYAKRGPRTVARRAREPLFLLSLIVSIFYLAMLTLPMLGAFYSVDPLALLRKSNLWLGPLQGLSASTLAIFFTKE